MSPFVRTPLLLLAVLVSSACSFGADAKAIPPPAIDSTGKSGGTQTAVLAGGCFWCTEVVFEQLAGVKDVVSGYAGGAKEQANYKVVSAGKTEHAEAIRIAYDPAKITYGQLLHVFFSAAHDPTQLNRQGPDWGKQYRSEIFYTSPEQKRIAEAYIQQLNSAGVFGQPVVTKLSELKGFYSAEDYHQDFVRNNPAHPYVVVNAVPKVKKLKTLFPELTRR